MRPRAHIGLLRGRGFSHPRYLNNHLTTLISFFIFVLFPSPFPIVHRTKFNTLALRLYSSFPVKGVNEPVTL